MQNPRVRKLFSTILGVGAVAGSLVLTSCEDEFTEEDAIRAQQETLAALKDQEAKNDMEAQAMIDSLNRIGAKIDYSVTIVAANKANTGSGARTSAVATLDGITVTIKQGGESMTATTEGGVATFTGLKAGKAVVNVDVAEEGYSSVTYTTLLGSDDKDSYSVGTLIPVLPITKAAGASVVTGKAWAEFDATNDAPELAQGATVQATVGVSDVLSLYGVSRYGYGGVENATYEGFVQTATVGEDGSYELVVPAAYGDEKSGISATIEALPFEHDQTYVKMNEDGSLETVTEKMIFGKGNDVDHIDTDIPSVYMEIEAPTGVAEGFEVKAELNKQFIAESDFDIVTGGTGYSDGDEFELSADDEGAIATFTVFVNGDGEITDIDYSDNGARYTKKPSVKAKTVNGSGASFDIDFTDYYKVVVSNPGSGYWTEPFVSMVTMGDDSQESTVLMESGDGYDLDGGAVEEKDYVLDNVYSNVEPTFTTINPVAKQAMVSPRLIVVEDGSIDEVRESLVDLARVSFGSESSDEFEGGAGYMTSPKVTIKNAKGEEVNAQAIAVVEDGEITEIKIVNPGTDISEVANDIDHDLSDIDFSNIENTLEPGSTTNVKNFNYSDL